MLLPYWFHFLTQSWSPIWYFFFICLCLCWTLDLCGNAFPPQLQWNNLHSLSIWFFILGVLLCFETETHISHASLKVTIKVHNDLACLSLLLPPPECWDDKCTPGLGGAGIKPRASRMPKKHWTEPHPQAVLIFTAQLGASLSLTPLYSVTRHILRTWQMCRIN